LLCGVCNAPIMGRGEDLRPLLRSRGCGNCALGAMHYKVHQGKDIPKETIIAWCRSGDFISRLKNHNRFAVRGTIHRR